MRYSVQKEWNFDVETRKERFGRIRRRQRVLMFIWVFGAPIVRTRVRYISIWSLWSLWCSIKVVRSVGDGDKEGSDYRYTHNYMNSSSSF